MEPSASAAEIRQAYRRLAYRLHPDRQAGASAAEHSLAERRMREVNVAWTTLSDARRRTDYDRTIVGPTTSVRTASDPRSPVASSAGGRGEWYDSDDPDAALARLRSRRGDALDDDEAAVDEDDIPGAGLWLLRRGPVVAMLAIGLVIFIGTAYAGRGASRVPTSTAVPPVVADSSCVKFMQDHMAYTVSCEGGYDAMIIRDEPNAIACASDGLDYAVVASKSVCVRAR